MRPSEGSVCTRLHVLHDPFIIGHCLGR